LELPSIRVLYDYSWFIGFAVSFLAYYGMMRFLRQGVLTPQEAAF